jgi:uncharacterized membrane protein
MNVVFEGIIFVFIQVLCKLLNLIDCLVFFLIDRKKKVVRIGGKGSSSSLFAVMWEL